MIVMNNCPFPLTIRAAAKFPEMLVEERVGAPLSFMTTKCSLSVSPLHHQARGLSLFVIKNKRTRLSRHYLSL